MCNLYSHTSNRQAILEFVRDVTLIAPSIGNLAPQPGIFPDYAAPIVRNTPEGRELAMVRWGLPSSQKALYDAASRRADKLRAKGKKVDFETLLKMEPDSGTTNIRNIFNGTRWNAHWNRWMGVENRCVVPFTSFSEFTTPSRTARRRGTPGSPSTSIWVKDWTSVRKVRTGLETTDLYGFLTCEPNDVVGSIHMKAMPVILTTPEEIDLSAKALAGWGIGDCCSRQ